MKKILLITAASLILICPAFAKDLKIEKKAGENTVILILEKNPPVTGENKAMIELKDASGKMIKDAVIDINYGMPAMPGMPAMNYTSKASMGKDAYEGMMNFSMPGPWNIELKIDSNNQKNKVKYNVDVK